MSRFSHTAKVLLLGLMIAQVIATVHVYLANVDLYRTLVAIKDGGYLVIPNRRSCPACENSALPSAGVFFLP